MVKLSNFTTPLIGAREARGERIYSPIFIIFLKMSLNLFSHMSPLIGAREARG